MLPLSHLHRWGRGAAQVKGLRQTLHPGCYRQINLH